MPGNRNTLFQQLLEFSERIPAFGFALATICALGGSALTFFQPKAIFGLGALCGWLLMGAASLFVVYAFLGTSIRYERKMRIRAVRQKQDLHDYTWQEFEEVVADAYRGQGFKVDEVGGQGDGGIDLILRRQSEVVVVQCKQWRSWQVGVRLIREFFGAMADQPESDRGIFVTCGVYTKEAQAYADRHGIELVDGDALLKLIDESNGRPQAAQTNEPGGLRQSLGASNEGLVPACPKCGSQMVCRKAGRGQNTGNGFWGCSTYPKCNGTRAIGRVA